LRSEFAEPLRPFGKHLECVPIRPNHRVEDTPDESKRHVRMEEIRHRIHEDKPRSLPLKRLIEPLGASLEVEPPFIGVAAYAPEALSERLGVPVRAARADFRASRKRIPCGIGP